MRFRLVLSATLMLGLAHLSPARASSFRFVLKDKAQVKEEQVRLSDIAAIERPGAEQTSASESPRVEDVVVARALLPGKTRTLRWGDIDTRLAAAGIVKGDYELAGAKQVTVRRTAIQMNAAGLQKLLEETLGQPVQFLTTPGEFTLPEGEIRLLVLNPPAAYTPTPTAISLALLIEGSREATITVIATFPGLTPPGASAAQSSVSATGQAKPPASSQRPMPPATQLTNSTSGQPLVHWGDLLRVVSTAGHVKVKAQGKALGDGRLNEIVSVSVEWTKEPLKAIVTGEGEVSVR